MREFLLDVERATIDTLVWVVGAFYLVVLFPVWFPLWAWRKLTRANS